MSANEKPWVRIAHSLPGRIRLRLSRAPRDSSEMIEAVKAHPGMHAIEFTPVTSSLLVRFDPNQVVPQEIVLRVAVCLSIDYGTVPVRVLVGRSVSTLADSAVFSALLLATDLAGRWTVQGPAARRSLDLAAGVGTAFAVLDHGWRELRERGYFDPEVISLGYLLTAFLRGDFLKASVVTWLVTFGRHLVELPAPGVEVRPLQISDQKGGAPRYEVVVSRDMDEQDRVRILGAFRGVVKYALTGGAAGGSRSLFEELRDVSEVHGEVLEGLGWMSQEIPVRFH